MSDNKRRMNPWVPAVIMGVVTVLFSVYAFQSQSELQVVKEENQQLKGQVEACERTAKEQQQRATEALKAAERAMQKAEESLKSNKRK